MPPPARLELGIHRRTGTAYSLEMRFWASGSLAETAPAGKSPLDVAIDMQRLLACHYDARAYGQYLTACLFEHPSARVGFASARAAAEALDAPLRLTIRVGPSAPELHGLRWETLLDPDRLTPLATDERILFSRYASSANLQPFQPPARETLRAQVLVANPSDLSAGLAPIDVAGEVKRARDGMAEMAVGVLEGAGGATLDRLLEALRDFPPDLLYLVAHGGIASRAAEQGGPQPFVLLEKPDGTRQPVLAADLAARLGDLPRLPFLAVLISCHSAGEGSIPDSNPLLSLGPLLVETGIPAVLAMHGSVSFATVAAFVPVFFKELQRDGQIDRAMAAARGRVRQASDWWMPVLFSRLEENRLFTLSPGAGALEVQHFEPETVFVPAGPFQMGRAAAPGVPAWETPAHTVDLPSYRIGRRPVTHRQYAEFIRQSGRLANPELGWNGQQPPAQVLDQPVTGVSWSMALEYCRWLSEKTGRAYALPTEAQWEKAARGTDGRLYPWGNEWSAEPFPPGPFGCEGMAGGVREWTLSLWGEKRSEPDRAYLYPWQEDGRSDPKANLQVRRVFRGGAGDDPARMTCTARGSSAPDQTGIPGKRFGFRVVMAVPSARS